jgi:hypothetical protein
METVLKMMKPNLAPSSVYNYVKNLEKLYRDVFGDDKYDLSKFDDVDKILDFLKDAPLNTRMSKLSYLSSLTGNVRFKEENAKLKVVRDTNPLPASLPENNIDEVEIKQKFKQLKKRNTQLFKRGVQTLKDLQEVQNTLLVAVTGNLFMEPRRSQDWTEMLLNGKDDKKNYIENNEFVFNVYKTGKYFGQQRIPIHPQIKKLIDQLRTVQNTEYLFTSIFCKQLQSITPRLKEIYGKDVSANSFRRNALREHRPFLEEKEKINEKMNRMGSSIKELRHYTR